MKVNYKYTASRVPAGGARQGVERPLQSGARMSYNLFPRHAPIEHIAVERAHKQTRQLTRLQ